MYEVVATGLVVVFVAIMAGVLWSAYKLLLEDDTIQDEGEE